MTHNKADLLFLPVEPVDGTARPAAKERRTPLSRLRLSELELSIRRRWFEQGSDLSYYPETLVRSILLSGAQPHETVWQDAVTASIRGAMADLSQLGLSRAAACMKMNELALCISDVVTRAPLDLVSAATLVEVANGALLMVRDHLCSEPRVIPADTTAQRRRTS